jgi:DNA-directed RNA polymerase specialized sigma24 family protein
VNRGDLREFLSRPETLRRARGIIREKVKPQDVDDLLNLAVADAMGKTEDKLPRQASTQAWFDRICRRRIADRYRKAARRKTWEGDMPEAPVLRDEAGEPVGDPGDAVADVGPSVDPEAPDYRAEGWLLTRSRSMRL